MFKTLIRNLWEISKYCTDIHGMKEHTITEKCTHNTHTHAHTFNEPNIQ